MATKSELEADLKQALQSKDDTAVSTLRLILSAVKNAEIAHRGELDEHQLNKVLSKEAKQRGESIESYRSADRAELADKEADELKVIEKYLPEQMSEPAINAIIDQVLAELKPAGLADMGKVMGAVTAKVTGRADGGKVAELVKGKLSQL